MCGIYGIVNFTEKQVDVSSGKKATQLLSHRGPDSMGYYADDYVFLGHTRLSIVDLNKRGSQPMHSQRGKLSITYNGEIYNFKKLRASLEEKGYQFNTETDTEVLLYLYHRFGKDCVQYLDGMFAFAIWDAQKKELFMARDPIGIKPLYYISQGDNFYFSSEIKSFFVHEEIPREIDFQSLNAYFAYDYMVLPKTLFKDIFEIPPGHIGTYTRQGLTLTPYWKLPNNQSFIDGSPEKINDLLKQAVEKRLMSDVPVGIFLSGGLDSSAVLAYVSEITKDPMNSVSLGYGVPEDELSYAKLIADTFNSIHHEVILDKDKAVSMLPEVVYHLDQPLAESTAVSYYFMAKHLKKYATVALSGEGSDELFYGYRKHLAMAKLKEMNHKNVLKHSSLFFSALQKIYPNIRSRKYIDYLKETLHASNDPVQSYLVLNYVSFYENELKKLFKDRECLKEIDFPRKVMEDCFKQRDMIFNKMSYFDYKVWLPGRLLMRIDKPTMAHAVETRVPFLDLKLLNYAMSIRPEARLGKKILIDALKNKLPQEILTRKKQGFYFPLNQWFSTRLKDALIDLKPQLKETGLFQIPYIEKIIKQHHRFRNDQKLWNILLFQIWHDIYINGQNYKKIRL